MRRRILCVLCAGMLAGILLTGCGKQNDTADADDYKLEQEVLVPIATTASTQETEPAETDASGTTAAAPDALTDDEIVAARKVLEDFWEACLHGDADAMLETTNLLEMMTLMYGELESEADLEELKAEIAEMGTMLQSYAIGEGRYDPEQLAEYNAGVQELLAEAEAELADAGAEERAEIEVVLKYIKPSDGLCIFPVTLTDTDGTEEAEDMYVLRIDGRWSLDTMMLELILTQSMLGAVEISQTTAANTAAKSAYNALNTALLNMDIAGVATLLQGNYMLTGSDFENPNHIARPETEADALEELKYLVTLYFSEMTSLDAVNFRIENGACIAVAVERSSAFGAYPNPLDADTADSIQSLEQAFSCALDGTL